jgi:hypothetical protein
MTAAQSLRTSSPEARRWRPLIVLLSALAFLWPAVIDGGPFMFSDSVEYIRGPDGAAGKLLGPHAKSEWSMARPVAKGQAAAPPAADQSLVGVPRTGRSIYYGLLANLGARTGGFWLTVFLQGYACVLAIDLLCRAIGWRRLRTFLLAVATATALTPFAIYAGYVMPDVFAAVLLTAAMALAAGADELGPLDVALATGLIAYSASTHTSHLGLLAGIILAAGAAFLIRRKHAGQRKAFAVLAGAGAIALAVALTASFAYGLAVKKAFGSPPIPVPFLTARMVADDHPGRDWLGRRCPAAGFVVCRFADRLPMTSNEFLWSITPPKTAFSTASLRDQAALGKEQVRFVLQVAKEEPLKVGAAFVSDWASQLVTLSLDGLNTDDDARMGLPPLMPDQARAQWMRSLTYRDGWPVDAMNLALNALTALALAALLALTVKTLANRGRQPNEDTSRLLAAGFIAAAGLLANAAVCGGMSGVFGRYEARISAPFILLGWFALALMIRERRARAA